MDIEGFFADFVRRGARPGPNNLREPVSALLGGRGALFGQRAQLTAFGVSRVGRDVEWPEPEHPSRVRPWQVDDLLDAFVEAAIATRHQVAVHGRRALSVGTVAVVELGCPDYLCADRIVYRPTPAEVGFYEYHRWAVSPREMIARYLAPMLADGIDTLVLGCTPYPLLTDAITRVLKRQIMLVDSAQNCARAVEGILDRQSLRTTPPNHGELHVALTDAADNFLNVARDALQLSFGEIELQPLP